MALVKFISSSGRTLTYGAYDEAAGTEIVAPSTSIPEIGSTGVYLVWNDLVIAGDLCPILEGGVVIGGGVADEHIALETTIASAASDSVFNLTAGPNSSPADDDMYNNMAVSVTDITGRVVATRRVTDYVASTRTITVDYAFEFNLAAGDIVRIWADTYSTTAGAAAAGEIRDLILNSDNRDYLQTNSVGQRIYFGVEGRGY